MAEFTVNLTEDEGYAIAWPAHRLAVMRRRVDFSETANNLVQNGIMSIFKIPADVVVLEYGMKVITADTDITTVDLGLYTETAALVITEVDADGFAVDVTLAATGYVGMDVDAVYNVQGTSALKPVAANSVLTVSNSDANTIDEAVVDFFAIVLDVSKPLGTTPGASDSYTT